MQYHYDCAAMRINYYLSALLFVLVLAVVAIPTATAFVHVEPQHSVGRGVVNTDKIIVLPTRITSTTTALFAAKKKSNKTKSKKSGGGAATGGFGGGGGAATKKDASEGVTPVKADKTALEKQWDAFASITDLEIKPLGDPEDEDYEHFEVVDVFVRCGGNGNDNDNADDKAATGWFRIGKVCASEETTIEAALTLQKGLIFWTAVHMRRELMALGKASATSMELGHISPAIIYMGGETDGPLDQDEADSYMKAFEKVSPSVLGGIKNAKTSFGFRPDWNPPGFTYKRREKAAMKDKKKKSNLEEIMDSSSSSSE